MINQENWIPGDAGGAHSSAALQVKPAHLSSGTGAAALTCSGERLNGRTSLSMCGGMPSRCRVAVSPLILTFCGSLFWCSDPARLPEEREREVRIRLPLPRRGSGGGNRDAAEDTGLTGFMRSISAGQRRHPRTPRTKTGRVRASGGLGRYRPRLSGKRFFLGGGF